MNWVRNFTITVSISLATLLAIDVIGYQFKQKIKAFLPNYGYTVEEFSRGYPVGHFRRDEGIGFDITPNFKVRTATKPLGYMPYDVWGNSYGCFDDEWSRDDLTGGIYLAGDSFTWGYARYEKKFGTVLEEILAKKVYACGVTHTGQGHQFEKFKRLYELGVIPDLVVVNVVSNDLDNDYYFPHTDIVDGVMVENIEHCGLFSKNNFQFRRFSHDEVETYVFEKRNEPKTIISLLKQYSLSANVIAEVTRSLRIKIYEARKSRGLCKRSVYAGLHLIGEQYLTSNLTEPNRTYISDWVTHAAVNGYKLIFSFIPSKDPSRNITYPYIKEFITSITGTYSSFDDFCDASCRSLKGAYHRFDIHFSEVGNQLYAEYLVKIIEDASTSNQ